MDQSSSLTPTGTSTSGKIVGLIITLLVVAGVIYLVASPLGKPASQPAGETPTQVSNNGKTNTSPPPPTERYAYAGEIVAVGANELTVKATAAGNAMPQDLMLKVTVDSSTTILQQVIRRATGDTKASASGQEPAKLSDLKPGDQVTILSATNVSGKTEFTASRIIATVIK